MVNLLFVFLKTFDKNIQKKIFNSRKSCNEIWWEHVEQSQIEEKYGGQKMEREFRSFEDLGL